MEVTSSLIIEYLSVSKKTCIFVSKKEASMEDMNFSIKFYTAALKLHHIINSSKHNRLNRYAGM